MNETNDPKLKPLAQVLRRRMTEEERRLWYDYLRKSPVTFQRQKVIGPYIVDFYLSELGIRVLRYSNVEINRNFRGVCEDILRYLPKDELRSTSSP